MAHLLQDICDRIEPGIEVVIEDNYTIARMDRSEAAATETEDRAAVGVTPEKSGVS